jgi:hypothetical protein
MRKIKAIAVFFFFFGVILYVFCGHMRKTREKLIYNDFRCLMAPRLHNTQNIDFTYTGSVVITNLFKYISAKEDLGFGLAYFDSDCVYLASFPSGAILKMRRKYWNRMENELVINKYTNTNLWDQVTNKQFKNRATSQVITVDASPVCAFNNTNWLNDIWFSQHDAGSFVSVIQSNKNKIIGIPSRGDKAQ